MWLSQGDLNLEQRMGFGSLVFVLYDGSSAFRTGGVFIDSVGTASPQTPEK